MKIEYFPFPPFPCPISFPFLPIQKSVQSPFTIQYRRPFQLKTKYKILNGSYFRVLKGNISRAT